MSSYMVGKFATLMMYTYFNADGIEVPTRLGEYRECYDLTSHAVWWEYL